MNDQKEFLAMFTKTLQDQLQPEKLQQIIQTTIKKTLEDKEIQKLITQTIKVKKLVPNAKLPFRATEQAACFDLYCLENEEPTLVIDRDEILWKECMGYVPTKVWKYRTGLAFEIPDAFELVIRPRSSISKIQAWLANSPGTIDSDYRGEIMVLFRSPSGHAPYKPGQRIAQCRLLPLLKTVFQETKELNPTIRNDKGFGSTGTN